MKLNSTYWLSRYLLVKAVANIYCRGVPQWKLEHEEKMSRRFVQRQNLRSACLHEIPNLSAISNLWKRDPKGFHGVQFVTRTAFFIACLEL